jgi:hypothetical protein
MKNYLKKLKNTKIVVVITLLVINALFSIVPVVNVRGDIDPVDINYSWSLDTFSAHISRVWDDSNFLMNESGSYNDVFNHSHGYAISDTEWIEEESVFTYNVNFSYYSNLTLTGDFVIDVNFDIYRVDISYNTSVYFIWIGFKNGTYNAEYVIDCITHDYRHENSFYKKTETTFKKYNLTTMELLDTWVEVIEDTGAWIAEPEPGDDNYTIYQTLDMEFSMPLIITFQVYETQNGEKVAWAEMISDFYIFDDKDGNGVYSIGETKEEQNRFHMSTSDEYCGMFMPWAHNITIHTDYWSPTHSFNDTNYYEPQLTGNEVDWSIKYPEFPIYGIIQTDTAFFYSGSGMDYADTSPSNFSYGYNYQITNETADLDFTAHLPKLSDPDFFNAADNLSLGFPHYTYFLSSAEIEETINPALTIPSSMFQFDLNDTKVAEINMDSEDKKNYTLMDYPDLGSNRTFEAIGSTVSKLISGELENNPSASKNRRP